MYAWHIVRHPRHKPAPFPSARRLPHRHAIGQHSKTCPKARGQPLTYSLRSPREPIAVSLYLQFPENHQSRTKQRNTLDRWQRITVRTLSPRSSTVKRLLLAVAALTFFLTTAALPSMADGNPMPTCDSKGCTKPG